MTKATVGSIAIGVQADIEPLRRGLSKSTKSLQAFSNKIKKTSKDLAKFGAAAAAAATAATAAIVANQAKTIDALAKTSDALGIATEKLQALNHLAELNGVSSDAMAKGLRRMERGLGEAARKGGTTADALEDAGISIQNILHLAPEQQMQKIADALGQIENQSIKASIASDLFGRDGINMLKVLTQLRKDGIEPTTEKLDRLGITISRVDAAKVEAANDAMFTARQVLTGIANVVTIELSPYIQEVADRFIAATEASQGFGDETQIAVDKILRAGANLADFLRGLHVVFGGLKLIGVGFGAAVISAFQLAAEGVTKFVDGAIKLSNKLIDALNKIPGVDIASIDLFTDSKFMEGLRSLGDAARNQVGELRAELHELAMQPMPSEQVEEFLTAVEERANKAAEAVAKVVSPTQTEEGQTFGPQNPTGAGIVDLSNDEFGFGPAEDPFDTTRLEEYQQRVLELEQNYWTNRGQITQHGLTGITSMIESSQGKQAGAVANSFASILGSTATYSKKAFELNKKFSLAQSVIKGYDAATSAWSAGMSVGGPFAPKIAAAYMAASIARTAAQIKAIRSQNFGGGGSSSAGGGTGGSVGALPGASVPQESNTRANTVTTINLQGEIFSRDSVGALIGQINDALEDGYTLRLNS